MYFCPLNASYICSLYGGYLQNNNNSPLIFTETQVHLINEMRMLWEQHGIWTREAIMSIALDLPNEEFVIGRLLQNPKDFEEALKNFYGDKIAATFNKLLSSHLVIASELVKASKAGDNTAAVEAEKRWYQNADEIAFFLGSINPYWSQQDWRMMLHEHLRLVKAEAVAFLTRDFDAAIKIFDEIEKQALEMADEMVQGIIKQFLIK